ncbi:hypothetical protein [Streptomyces sp. URMC 123]|uniref:hypothetical protein n=1 Tax=Streptomyces sp. URMC 123 TaxID=3423403 RepID=UPI003F1D7118
MTGRETVADILLRLAAEGATGALHGPLGVLYLDEGLVAHAESPLAPDAGVVLTAGGRLSADLWNKAVAEAGADRSVGRFLVEYGCVGRGELELCHTAALHDAAYFALFPESLRPEPPLPDRWLPGSPLAGPPLPDAPPPGPPLPDGERPSRPARFLRGARHWLGPVRAVPAAAVCREADRRRALLGRVWPWPAVDVAPVRPNPGADAHSGPGTRPTRRALEVLAAADGARTPCDIARLLGRATFATLYEVRRLAAAGYLDTPDAGGAAPALGAPGTGDGVPDGRPAPPQVTGTAPGRTDTAVGATRTGDAPALRGTRTDDAPAPRAARADGVPPPRRRGNGGAAAAAGAAAQGPGAPDISLLFRIRAALEAHL